MDMTKLSMEKCQGQQRQASGSALGKVKEQVVENTNSSNKKMGEESIKALEQAAQPYLGGNIDIKG